MDSAEIITVKANPIKVQPLLQAVSLLDILLSLSMCVCVKFKPCDLLSSYPVCVVRQCSGSDNNAVMKQGSSQAKRAHTHTHAIAML